MMGLFQKLFGWLWEWLLGPFKDLRGFRELIFGKDKDVDLAYGIFTQSDINNIYMPGMNAFVAIAVTVILVGIVIAGMRISSAGINPSNRTYFFEFFKDLIIVTILLFNLSTLYHFIFGINYTIINVFASADKELIDLKDKLDTSKGVLGELLIQLTLLGLAIWANFYYMMRRLTLLLLMIMGPLMAALYLIPQTKGITMGWLKEMIGSVFVQSVHAALFWMISLMSTSTSGIEGVILYVIFIPVSESIRALFGLGGQMNDRFSKSAAMFGGAAIAGMYGSVKGALGGKSVTEALRGAYNGVKNRGKDGKGAAGSEDGESKGKLLNNVGTDTSATARAERMLKAGEILSKSGKAIFGAAGAVVGSPMGPMGSIAGSTIGFNAGGVVGGVAGRTGMFAAETAGRRLVAGAKASIDKAKGIHNAEAKADEKLASSMADEQTTKWANDNFADFKKDYKERFPDAHDSSVNSAWDKAVSDKRGEYLNKARQSIGAIKKNDGQYAKANELINSTVDNLANDWAKNNKENFINNYDKAHPLPSNATEADILKHNQNREKAWGSELDNKRNAIKQVATRSAEKLGNYRTVSASDINKDEFIAQVGKDIGSITGMDGQASMAAVKNAVGAIMPNKNKKANASELVKATVENLTNDWASANKKQFMSNYDSTNQLPATATESEVKQHIQNRENAWQSAVASKKQTINQGVQSVASKLGNAQVSELQYINRNDFANSVGNELGSIIGKGNRESVMAVKGATSAVKNTSLYSGKTVNTDYLANQLAQVKTAQEKDQFISQAVSSGQSTQAATKQWNQVEAPKRFAENYNKAQASVPRHIPLDHSVKFNNSKTAAALGGAGAFLSGTSGVKEISQFVADTKLGHTAYGFVSGLKNGASFDMSQGVITGTKQGISSAIVSAGQTAVSHYKNHVPSNVLEKQVGFKNAVAYSAGIVGGVAGYYKGASFASGGSSNITRNPGGLTFGFNPYNKAAYQQISEVSDIAHMAQTIVDPNGNTVMAQGAVRMVTTSDKTVIQIKDKTGQVQTVSRFGSGDSSLQKGQTIYQDLTIQSGELVTASNVYSEDSGGGRVTLNRSINVNPNKILANHNNPKTPRIVQEVQSYNQQVESGQYSLKQATTEMSDIHMVVDRNRSYLVGTKEGKEYRISSYGPGDARLSSEETIYRNYEIRNSKLVPTINTQGSKEGEAIDYTSTLEVTDLLPKYPPNKRSQNRKMNEKYRNKSFTESLG